MDCAHVEFRPRDGYLPVPTCMLPEPDTEHVANVSPIRMIGNNATLEGLQTRTRCCQAVTHAILEQGRGRLWTHVLRSRGHRLRQSRDLIAATSRKSRFSCPIRSTYSRRCATLLIEVGHSGCGRQQATDTRCLNHAFAASSIERGNEARRQISLHLASHA